MSEVVEKIKNLIEKELNPTLKLHAGSAELVAFEDGIVSLKLFGGCSGCPSSTIALFNSVAPILKERIAEVEDVILA